MRIWNTMTREKAELAAGPLVRIYVCGITPYDTTHLGHARTYLTFDVLIRELEHRGHDVRYAQNVTDVDDPLFERAQQLGITSAELARACTRIFQDDLAALRIRPPDYFPRASDTIQGIQDLITSLLARGHAYRRADKVYFRVSSFPNYGRLSRFDRASMLASSEEHGEDLQDPLKDDPLDFVLWKPSRPGETAWPSLWGEGRPGWHVECSAMALTYLGPELDIHGGGADLIYPHHESEIAQSEAASGHSPFARVWMHVGMVQLGGVKMSKSLGNLILVRDLRSRVRPMAIRHYLLSTHYRADLAYSESDLRKSVRQIERLEEALRQSDALVEAEALAEWGNRFDAALADDLDTPTALTALASVTDLILGAGSRGTSSGTAALRQMAARLGLGEISPTAPIGRTEG